MQKKRSGWKGDSMQHAQVAKIGARNRKERLKEEKEEAEKKELERALWITAGAIGVALAVKVLNDFMKDGKMMKK